MSNATIKGYARHALQRDIAKIKESVTNTVADLRREAALAEKARDDARYEAVLANEKAARTQLAFDQALARYYEVSESERRTNALEWIAEEFHRDIGNCLDHGDRVAAEGFAARKLVANGWTVEAATAKAHEWLLIDRQQRFGH